MSTTLVILKKIAIQIFKIALLTYIVLCVLLYFLQEKLIFYPDKLDTNYRFPFAQPFEEINIKAEDGILLNGLLFTTNHPKGLIFYLHGNAGSLASWGKVAETYTNLDYDVFVLDYRGYGKSEGQMKSQEQMFEDVQAAYDAMKAKYSEDKIVVLGYSIGTGPATKLASSNHPKRLILQAPYYSLADVMKGKLPLVPAFLLKYKFATNQYLKKCRMPVVMFHGDRDEVIPYQQSVKLKPLLKQGDRLITLQGQGHNGITENGQYRNALKQLLQ